MNPDNWSSLVLPLAGGLNESTSPTGGVPPAAGLRVADNVVFDKPGSLRARPSYSRTNAFRSRTITANGRMSDVARASLAATGYTATAAFASRDARGERPGIMCPGRVFTFDDGAWRDRLGTAGTKVRRLTNYKHGFSGAAPGELPAVADNFGVTDAVLGSSSSPPAVMLSQDGSVLAFNASTAFLPAPAVGPGSGARCAVDGVTATVSVLSGTNDLVITLRNGVTLTSVLLATDARAPDGLGDNPVVCCDEGVSSFLVVYLSTAARTFRLLRVSTAGVILATGTVVVGTAGATVAGYWACNTVSVVSRLILAAAVQTVGPSVVTVVIDATTLTAVAGLDANWSPPGGFVQQVVCGAAANDTVYVAAKQGGNVVWSSRPIASTAAMATAYTFYGQDYGHLGSPQTNVPEFYLLHQPILVRGRVLLGLSVQPGWDNGSVGQAHTWLTLDITDTWRASTGVGTKRIGTIVARGPLHGSTTPWSPFAATKVDENTWRFPTADYQTFAAPTLNAAATTRGYDAALGINEISWLASQVDTAGESTVIGGNVPHALSRGFCYEVGFPYLEAPSISAVVQAGPPGSLAVGVYQVRATWRWLDESGQTHRSAPSAPLNVLNNIANARLVVTGSVCQITEREYGDIVLEVWVSPVDTADIHHLSASVSATPGAGTNGLTSAIVPFVATTQSTLYTDSGELPTSHCPGDGGIALVGRRCWASDGSSLFASKLLQAGSAPAWSNELPLTVTLPAAAGQVVGLHAYGTDTLVVLCERGVYLTGGEGPEDSGLGQPFRDPVRVSFLGVAGPRASVSTSRGVVFQARPGSALNSQPGGLWLLSGQELTHISSRVEDRLGTGLAELSFFPEREWLFVNQVSSILVLDMREGLWSTWGRAEPGFSFSMTVAAGVPWSVAGEPGRWDGSSNQDVTSVAVPFQCSFETNDLPVFGDPLAWGRVRSLQVLGDLAGSPVLLVYQATLDQSRSYSHTFTALDADGSDGAAEGRWPVDNLTPEWRLPTQKCSLIRVQVQFSPGCTLTHLRIMRRVIRDIKPSKARA